MEKHLFYDELGDEIEFLIDAKFTLDDTDYVAMVPADEDASDIYLLRIEFDDEGNEVFVGIDDNELKEVKEVYEELLKEDLQ